MRLVAAVLLVAVCACAADRASRASTPLYGQSSFVVSNCSECQGFGRDKWIPTRVNSSQPLVIVEPSGECEGTDGYLQCAWNIQVRPACAA